MVKCFFFHLGEVINLEKPKSSPTINLEKEQKIKEICLILMYFEPTFVFELLNELKLAKQSLLDSNSEILEN